MLAGLGFGWLWVLGLALAWGFPPVALALARSRPLALRPQVSHTVLLGSALVGFCDGLLAGLGLRLWACGVLGDVVGM